MPMCLSETSPVPMELFMSLIKLCCQKMIIKTNLLSAWFGNQNIISDQINININLLLHYRVILFK